MVILAGPLEVTLNLGPSETVSPVRVDACGIADVTGEGSIVATSFVL